MAGESKSPGGGGGYSRDFDGPAEKNPEKNPSEAPKFRAPYAPLSRPKPARLYSIHKPKLGRAASDTKRRSGRSEVEEKSRIHENTAGWAAGLKGRDDGREGGVDEG